MAPPSNHVNRKLFAHLIEVFINNFIQAAQTTNEAMLRHLSSALLHGIHSVFPPPKWTGHKGENPIHEKKTRLEGTWEFQKEILGWVFDGINCCIQLPDKKVQKLLELLKPLRTANAKPTKEMETL